MLVGYRLIHLPLDAGVADNCLTGLMRCVAADAKKNSASKQEIALDRLIELPPGEASAKGVGAASVGQRRMTRSYAM